MKPERKKFLYYVDIELVQRRTLSIFADSPDEAERIAGQIVSRWDGVRESHAIRVRFIRNAF